MVAQWIIALRYPTKMYYIKTKNPIQTLAKIAKKESFNEVTEIGIKPPRHYYWHIIQPRQLEKLLSEEEVETVIMLHYPPLPGEGYGKGTLQLPKQ